MFDALFTLLEDAIDAHPAFERVRPKGCPTFVHEPVMEVTRAGFAVRIRVRLTRSRKKPGEIWGQGETPESAVQHLIDGLDHYATAMDWKPLTRTEP